MSSRARNSILWGPALTPLLSARRHGFFLPLQVGAHVKGRVLTVDAASSKATLTLKRSMVKDPRDAISTYEEVSGVCPSARSC